MGEGVDVQSAPRDFSEYSAWAQEHDHTVQVSFQRSGRVWISSMVIFLCGDNINRRVPLDSKFYDASNMIDRAYYTTHLYEDGAFPLFEQIKYVLLIRDPRSALLSRLIWVENHAEHYNASALMQEWIKEWVHYIQVFSTRQTLIVQYEEMCLYPQEQLDRIIDFAGFDAVNGLDKLHRLGVLSDESGADRFQQYCLKWRHHDQMVECYNDRIWRELREVMEEFGYNRGGYQP